MKHNLANHNLFMKVCFQEGTHVIFLHSDDKGIEHLNKILQDNPLLGNLFTIEEVLKPLVSKFILGFSINKWTGVFSSKWIGNKIMVSPEEKEIFDEKYSVWKKDLTKYLGPDNLYEVHIPCDELDNYLDTLGSLSKELQETKLLSFLDKYQFSIHLNETLNELKTSKSAKKI